jgi:hypothetical protein
MMVRIMKLCVDRFPRSFIGSALIVLLSCQGASGTVIYLRVSPGEVIIAADSKRVVVRPDGNTQSINVCKIGQAGDVFFTSAGIGGSTGAGFDVGQVARQAIVGGGTLLEMVQAYQRLIRAPLLKTLEIIRDREPMRYKGFLRGAAVQTVFARVEKRSPVVIVSGIKPVEGLGLAIELDFGLYSCPGNCKLPDTLSVGRSPKADQIEARTKNFWDKGSVAGVRELMQISIADNPRETGEPVDILRISEKGGE